MAKEFSRNQRVAEQLRRELADLLQFEVKDPRAAKVTLTEVDVSGDLSHAKIYFVTQSADAQSAAAALTKAAGFLRSQLSHRMLMRTVPQLHFVYDESLDRGMRMSQLIDQANSDSSDKS
ncbi:ribosome-binding factor A [Novimethylophilus kurashikiensis]|uniref:Ribosome-binding factor A n=1 Tax=Novimethylophilus kurashikiensis TaxID=1825523 RepID=A0A2R5FEZ5_9PROT|nr:30S ribosome-binding factor RbfA [Novimethylophilus kurashikiensis]GBG15898.1 ribosome-binding factor A [Novimethylophilus kurashikiensis]